MNKRNALFSLFVASTVILSGCTLAKMIKMAQEQQLTVQPSPLELHGDSVKFEMSALLPANMLKKNTIYTVSTFYQYGDVKLDLGTIQFAQSEFPNKEQQPKISKPFAFAYKEEYKRGKIMVMGTAAKVTGKSKETPVMELADGVITTSQLVKTEGYATYAFHGYNNQEELIPTNVEFFFEKGSAKLRTTELKGDEGKKMDAYIAAKNQTKTVAIIGHHSPEGSETINSNLSSDRAKAIEKFYRDQMKKYDYKKKADSVKFVITPVIQDWKMFREAIKNTAILTDAQKAEVYKIVENSKGSFVDTEKELQKLAYYKTIKNDIYPPLRTAKTEILMIKSKKTDAQISILASQISKKQTPADALSGEEMGYAATLTPDLNEKEAIYKAWVEKTQSWQAYNNLGAVYLEMAMKAPNAQKNELVEKAIAQLNISIKKEESAENMANLTTANAMLNQREAAIGSGEKALSLSKNVDLTKNIKSTLAPQYIKKGQYTKAIDMLGSSSMSNTSQYNIALAQLLNKDFDTAKKNFDKVTTADNTDSWAYYCTAVAAARMGDEAMVAARLKKAIELESSLRGKAMDDLEFQKYWDKEAFKNAIK